MRVKTICYCVSIVVLVGALATAQPKVDRARSSVPALTDWVDYRFDAAHTGFNSLETVLGPGNVGGLVPDMQYRPPTATASAYAAPPVLVNGVIYVGGNENLYAINAATGVVLWKFKAAVPGYPTTSPTVANGVVYVGAYNPGALFALNAQTGVVLWTYPYTASYNSPTVAGGLVYLSNGSQMLALNANTGAVVWQWQKDGYLDIVTTPAVANGAVYFGIREDALYHGVIALDAASGQLLWDHAAPLFVVDENTVAVDDGLVFFMSMLTMYALDGNTGNVVWSSNLGDSANLPLTAGNGVVYVAGFYTVYALDEHTGAVVWTHSTGSDPASTSTILANGVLYAATQTKAYALNASTGALLWENDGITDNFGTSPLVVNGELYVATASTGRIYSFHLPQ